MSTYRILQGDGLAVQKELDNFAKQGYVPILYSTTLIPGGPRNPGRINHCLVIELKEEKKAEGAEK